MTDLEEEILEVLDGLALALTGHTLQRHQARGFLINQLVEGQEFYLPDGGYSRLVVSIVTGKAFLTSNSRNEAKRAWGECRQLIDDLEQAVLMRRQEIDPTYKVARCDELLKTAPIKTVNVNHCPHVIMLPSHYRDDGSCKCDDPDERALMIAQWEYTEDDFKGIPLRSQS